MLVTCTRLRRCVRFVPKYSAVPFCSFFSLIFQARLAKFHRHLYDRLSNTGARRAIYDLVQLRQLAE